jgi:hypothetical protein
MSRWNKVRIKKKDRKQAILVYFHQLLALNLLCNHGRFEIFLSDTPVKYSILPLLQNQMYRENILYTLRITNFPSFHGFVDKYRKCMIYMHAIDRYLFSIQFWPLASLIMYPPTAKSCKRIIHLFPIIASFILVRTISLLNVGWQVRVKLKRVSIRRSRGALSHV